jgi:salicylate 5-hydroxylase small subunit
MTAALSFDTWLALQQLQTQAANALDNEDWDAWVACFTVDAEYRLVPRENHERGLPLATMAFESQAMLKDRIYAIRETLFHDPYHQRHLLSPMQVLSVAADGGSFDTQTSYAVFRTKHLQLSEVFNLGRYLDRIVHTPEGLRFARRLVVYDSELIPNSVIYPI